ncbi:hypothetical protein V6N12_066671 [Hibiscus sabdariffa]|uniref:Uncharacterized protein n=1 Tax=Hibiscus sabdariffa TaxID=183260 RepID=A0ABR2BE35_9ROSI
MSNLSTSMNLGYPFALNLRVDMLRRSDGFDPYHKENWWDFGFITASENLGLLPFSLGKLLRFCWGLDINCICVSYYKLFRVPKY